MPRWMRWAGRALFLLAGLWMVDLALTRALFGTGVPQPLAGADRVVVRMQNWAGDRPTGAIITDPAAVGRIIAFVDARPRGWEKSWHTPPVTRVHAIFYDGDTVLGWFASGKGFFQAPAPDGQAAMRRAGSEEVAELHRLLGLPTPGAR